MGHEGLGCNGRHGREKQADVEVCVGFYGLSGLELEAEGMDS